MSARDLPITPGDHSLPIARIDIFDEMEALAAKGMEFIISPILVSQHGTSENKVIGFNLRALGALEDARLHRAAMIAPNHPVNQTTIIADNQVVKEI